MTATIALRSATTTSFGTGRPRAARLAGFTYVAAWVVGLTALGVGPAADASNAEITRYFADHRALSTIQSLLIHGVAALALLVVLVAVKRAGRATTAAHAAGLAAVGLSLLQCGLDVYRSLVATGSTTATLVHAIDRIDGLKMFAFAVMIAASLRVFRSTGMIGRTMAVVGGAAVAALVVSGAAYTLHVVGLLASGELSLLLLLVWVASIGTAASRTTR
jgi:hypothetical protein